MKIYLNQSDFKKGKFKFDPRLSIFLNQYTEYIQRKFAIENKINCLKKITNDY